MVSKIVRAYLSGYAKASFLVMNRVGNHESLCHLFRVALGGALGALALPSVFRYLRGRHIRDNQIDDNES